MSASRDASSLSDTIPVAFGSAMLSGFPVEDVPVQSSNSQLPVQGGRFDGTNSIIPNQAVLDVDSWTSDMNINWLDFQSFEDPVSSMAGLELTPFPSSQPFLNFPSNTSRNGQPRPSGQAYGDTQLGHSPYTGAASTASVSTHSPVSFASVTERAEPGELYVDGQAARLPRVKRRKLSTLSPSLLPGSERTGLSLDLHDFAESSLMSDYLIQDEAYRNIAAAYAKFCIEVTYPVPAFESMEAPSRGLLQHLAFMYFEHFHPTFPIIQISSFRHNASHWLLVLAVASLGSHYVERRGLGMFSLSMHEFIRRVIREMDEYGLESPIDEAIIAQIKVLHSIGTVYCGNEQLRRSGLKLRQDLALFVQTRQQETPAQQQPAASSGQRWSTWCEEESRRRAVFGAWLIDSFWVFDLQKRPFLSLEDADRQLPCHEKLWAATDPSEWDSLYRQFPKPPTLIEALRDMYIEKHVLADIGEFGRTLLIYGLICRSREVEAYFRQTLSHWNPSAQKQVTRDVVPASPIWLPSVSTFAKWRNSACDCLDILHWDANAKIGAASGLEHPTVLHLHLARVLLLTPICDILAFVQSATDTFDRSNPSIATQKARIQRWAVKDQYKARLAMIHAAVLFWHVRRHSANGFYEAPAVGLAALALWAFATFSPKKKVRQDEAASQSDSTATSKSSRNRSGALAEILDDEEDEDACCDIILLDRPTDDELVQSFVRRGHALRAHMSGVGDLYGERGPEKVLLRGQKLLSSLNCWRVADSWHRLLKQLADVSVDNMVTG